MKLQRELVASASSKFDALTEDLNLAIHSTSTLPSMSELGPMGPSDAFVLGADQDYPCNVVPSSGKINIL